MQIVINISNTLKNLIDQNDLKTLSHAMWQFIMIDAIKNGTPLPKGHGRLIDGDMLEQALNERHRDYEHTIGLRQTINEAVRDGITISMVHVEDAPTIVEADKE